MIAKLTGRWATVCAAFGLEGLVGDDEVRGIVRSRQYSRTFEAFAEGQEPVRRVRRCSHQAAHQSDRVFFGALNTAAALDNLDYP